MEDGDKNKLCFNNSLHQTVAAVRLTPVCIKPVSELRLQFKSDSSAAAVRLSPELSSFNEDSSESTESEQLYSVKTHEFEHIEMTLNNEPVVLLIDKEESTVYRSQETEDYHLQQSSEQELSEDVQLQDSLDNRTPYFEDFDSPDEDSKNLDNETSGAQNPDNVLSKAYCHECEIKSEEEQNSSDCTVAAVRLSPVTTLVKDSKPPVRPSINKRKERQPLTTPHIVFRERPPRKPPDNYIKQDGKQVTKMEHWP